MNNGNYDEESAQDQPIVEELAGDATAETEVGVEASGVGSQAMPPALLPAWLQLGFRRCRRRSCRGG